MIADIFISHASRDRDPARTLCEALENRGFGCWMASRDIGPGENFQVAIVRAIRAAKVMILVFSSNSNNSEEIKKELVLAGQSQLIVIPVRVEDVTPDEAFAYELAIRQWIDLFDDWERAVQRLVRQLEAVVGIKRTLPPEAEPQHSPNLTRTMQATSASAAEQNFSSATEVAKATMPAVPPTFTLSNEAAPSAAPSAEDTGGAPTSPASPVPGNASPTTEVSSFRSTETANGTVPPSTTRTVLRLAVPAAVIVPIVTALIGGAYIMSLDLGHAPSLDPASATPSAVAPAPAPAAVVSSAPSAPAPPASAPIAAQPVLSADELFEKGLAAQNHGDYAEALRWYQKAADQGNAVAQASIAQIYYFGNQHRCTFAAPAACAAQ